ncbi:MAG: hypothetical protein MJ131_11675 [Lachnospiraceae bacterium]|nr:hypothetical protein [Lachnospiraceae bacterium]
MEKLFNEFKKICLQLNKIGIIPTLMGSLGLEYMSKVEWNPGDIDIHVPGDPRGWEAPDELRVKLVTASLVTRYKIAATAAYEVRGLNPAPRESFTHRLKAVGYLSILYIIGNQLSLLWRN